MGLGWESKRGCLEMDKVNEGWSFFKQKYRTYFELISWRDHNITVNNSLCCCKLNMQCDKAFTEADFWELNGFLQVTQKSCNYNSMPDEDG